MNDQNFHAVIMQCTLPIATFLVGACRLGVLVPTQILGHLLFIQLASLIYIMRSQ